MLKLKIIKLKESEYYKERWKNSNIFKEEHYNVRSIDCGLPPQYEEVEVLSTEVIEEQFNIIRRTILEKF